MVLVKTGTTHNNSFNGSLSRATLVTWYQDKTLSLTPSLSVCGYYTVSQRNVPPLTCYSLDTHDLITVIFGRIVTSKKSDDALCSCFSITFQKRKPRRQRTGALCMQHSSTAAALSTSFLLNHATQQFRAKCIDYKI